ncbi:MULTISPECIES: hypothetical protein [unclassified Mesorhizobium]|uniref:hypothetical protein n=1 Tax=unclassified Mesorhizobium TaxID=325217 RepID=UPI0003CFDFE7|nr:hypothetical protein [Mesorhizobium sp. L2C085B000]ESZ17739.1 hypothetical protein X735_11535 [Mesorhizobium sp. L2C085B000]
MTDAARATISNGIWLCVMCHTVIDKEERNYSPDLLFHWRNSHEAKITAERGKPKELIRLREEERQMNDFADVSLFAQQIIRDKPPGWEYQLTAEALDNVFTPILRRWKDLHAGSYTKDVGQQKPNQYLRWVGAQIPELPKIAESLGDLINNRLKEAWGAEGVPGDPKEIVHVCRMIAARATRLLQWDEAMHFVTPAKGFEIVPKHLSKGVAVVMEKIPYLLFSAPFSMRVRRSPAPIRGPSPSTFPTTLTQGWRMRWKRVDWPTRSAGVGGRNQVSCWFESTN